MPGLGAVGRKGFPQQIKDSLGKPRKNFSESSGETSHTASGRPGPRTLQVRSGLRGDGDTAVAASAQLDLVHELGSKQ